MRRDYEFKECLKYFEGIEMLHKKMNETYRMMGKIVKECVEKKSWALHMYTKRVQRQIIVWPSD